MTQSIPPREAVDMYLDARRDEVANSTLTTHRRRLKHFVRWCENVEKVEVMADLNGRH